MLQQQPTQQPVVPMSSVVDPSKMTRKPMTALSQNTATARPMMSAKTTKVNTHIVAPPKLTELSELPMKTF
jgi:hypothetical protein